MQVNINDELPKHICKECLNELNIAYIFRIKCEKTQYKLNKLLQLLDDNNKFNFESKELCDIPKEKEEVDCLTNENHLNVNTTESNEIVNEFLNITDVKDCTGNNINNKIKSI